MDTISDEFPTLEVHRSGISIASFQTTSSDRLPSPRSSDRLPLTVIVAVRNEIANIRACLQSLMPAERVIVIDSNSTDGTDECARGMGAEVVQYECFPHRSKKRQWALDSLDISSPWVMLIDADEQVPLSLWDEIRGELFRSGQATGYLINKGFWFLGRQFRFGGFSHSAVLLFQRGKARFEKLEQVSNSKLDMEVHERLIVDGRIGRLRTPLIHHDFKGLTAYLERHNHYATWEASVRHEFFRTGSWGESSIRPRLLGDVQERRRFLKQIVCHLPGEPALWFFYHYVLRLGILEGRRGLIACLIRAQYISNVRAKLFELQTMAADLPPGPESQKG